MAGGDDMDMDMDGSARRRHFGQRWFGIEFAAVATLVTIAWINEPSSLERLGLMCACWAPFVFGAALRVRSWLRSQG
jgi:hypothetical protein